MAQGFKGRSALIRTFVLCFGFWRDRAMKMVCMTVLGPISLPFLSFT